jgi:hypothetical protein
VHVECTGNLTVLEVNGLPVSNLLKDNDRVLWEPKFQPSDLLHFSQGFLLHRALRGKTLLKEMKTMGTFEQSIKCSFRCMIGYARTVGVAFSLSGLHVKGAASDNGGIQ